MPQRDLDREIPKAALPQAEPSEPSEPWVPASVLRQIVRESPSDAELLDDLADARSAELDD